MAIRINLSDPATAQCVAQDGAHPWQGVSPSDARLIAQAKDLGINLEKAPIDTLRGLGTADLLRLKQEQELAECLAQLQCNLSACTAAEYANAHSPLSTDAELRRLVDLTTDALNPQEAWESISAATALSPLSTDAELRRLVGHITDAFNPQDAWDSISAATAAVAHHGAGFEAAWLAQHTGGVEQYAAELSTLINPLASIHSAIGTADGELLTRFDHLASAATHLQSTGVAVAELLKLAQDPANQDASPDSIAERFVRKGATDRSQSELMPFCPPVQPYIPPPDRNSEALKKELAHTKEELARSEESRRQTEALLARAMATIEAVAHLVPAPSPTDQRKGQADVDWKNLSGEQLWFELKQLKASGNTNPTKTIASLVGVTDRTIRNRVQPFRDAESAPTVAQAMHKVVNGKRVR